MTGLVFVDSSVLVYSVDARDPRKQLLAHRWLDELWRARTGRLSVQVLNEFYVNATRSGGSGLAQATAWAVYSSFRAWQPHAIDESLVDRAREIQVRHRRSWWDCLIVAAAHVQGCSMLLSGDFSDGELMAGVTVRNPFTDRVQAPIAGYAAIIARPEPRGRGRPRRMPVVTRA